MAGISLIVGGVGVMNIMLVSVTERTREVGLRKAVGAKRGHILTQFLMEASAMSAVGGGLGVLAGWGVSRIIPRLDIAGQSIPTVMNVSTVVLALGVSVITGLVFGVYPAYRAARLNPIDALRYE
ncbi:MAG: FtsX-like permease family protein, partial [Dehalococcoidia bacterium]|nr:FtsX-like permease family protein [Dehalococcoidia bacterium]